jgi:hypothetical protein
MAAVLQDETVCIMLYSDRMAMFHSDSLVIQSTDAETDMTTQFAEMTLFWLQSYLFQVLRIFNPKLSYSHICPSSTEEHDSIMVRK